jgi:Na+-translocating ferredoxin:NAD+ oxidoreductase subunit A
VSYLGIVVGSAFASNALLTYGFGSISEHRREGGGALASALALALVNVLASAFLWAVHGFLLSPLGLGSLDIIFFSLIAVPVLKFVSRAAAVSGESAGGRKEAGASLDGTSMLARIGGEADDLIVGSLVFGIALLASRGAYSFPEAVVASLASGLGYWLAIVLLESLRARLELSDLPAPFKGAPAMLISAGLMALAFMGLDSAFVKSLAG